MNLKNLNVDPEQAFPEIEPIIHKLAHRFAKTYPVTFEDARSEAYLAFMKACSDYNPEKKKGHMGKSMKFSSWAYYWIWTDLKTWVTKRTLDPHYFSDKPIEQEAPPSQSPALEALEDLSEDAKEIISLFLEMPEEFSQVKTIHQLITATRRYFTRPRAAQKRNEDFNQSFEEIKQRLQAVWATS